MGAIKREMNNGKWTSFAIGYQCVFAYATSVIIYQFGMLFTGAGFGIGTVFAILTTLFLGYMLFRPYKNGKNLKQRSK